MSDAINLQEAILKEVRRDKIPVTLFLMNGFQLRGTITGYDSFVVVLVSDGKQQMITVCIDKPIVTNEDIDNMIDVINTMYTSYLVSANLKK